HSAHGAGKRAAASRTNPTEIVNINPRCPIQNRHAWDSRILSTTTAIRPPKANCQTRVRVIKYASSCEYEPTYIANASDATSSAASTQDTIKVALALKRLATQYARTIITSHTR